LRSYFTLDLLLECLDNPDPKDRSYNICNIAGQIADRWSSSDIQRDANRTELSVHWGSKAESCYLDKLGDYLTASGTSLMTIIRSSMLSQEEMGNGEI
jgi:hypothetical protein